MNWRTVWGLVKDTGSSWVEDKATRLAAALAYYTILSAAPLLMIALAIAGRIFGPKAVEGRLVEQLGGLMGEDGAQAIQTMIAHASAPGSSAVALVIGAVTLLVGASGVFVELQDALNTIWGVVTKPGRTLWMTVRDRLMSFAMVFGTGFLLLVTLVLSAVLAALTEFVGLAQIGVVGEVLNFAVSFAVITLLFALMFKFLPDVKIAWDDVWIGAGVTALLFALGKFLIGLYLGHAGVGSAYGAAGSMVVFVVWVYYSGLILYFGAEFTKVYTARFGSGFRPTANAVPVTPEARAQQGMVGTAEPEPAGRR
jgi:membrane protein